MSPRRTVAVIFGGCSGEHDVSCRSAQSVVAHLAPERYDVVLVRIDRDGCWRVGLEKIEPDDPLRPGSGRPGRQAARSVLAGLHELRAVDIAFPVLHGPYGEDGTLQSGLQLAGVPFVGNGTSASALAMDKVATKKIAAAEGLAVADAVVIHQRTAGSALRTVRDRLGLPLVVKPIRDGSSIGVSWVGQWSQLDAAVTHAAASGGGVLVERAVIGREIDVGVLETADGVLHVSPTLEITTSHGAQLFDFHAKYDDPDTRFEIPAALDPPTVERLEQAARAMFAALGCAGLLRVDFFLRDSGELVLNEVNSMPGFTTASQYPQMWQRAGIDYPRLLDLLIESALARGTGPGCR